MPASRARDGGREYHPANLVRAKRRSRNEFKLRHYRSTVWLDMLERISRQEGSMQMRPIRGQARVEFGKTRFKSPQRNVDRAWHVAQGKFIFRPHI